MGILSRLLRRRNNGEEIQIVSRRPVGKFKVKETFRIGSRIAITGVMENGMVTAGYKVKGKGGVALIYRIERRGSVVDFIVEGDEAALILEGELKTDEGEVLEVYTS